MEKANLNRNTNGLSSQGKLILLVLIVVGLMAGGYLFYTGNNKTQKPQENISNLPTLEEMSIEKEKKSRNATEEIEVIENEDNGKRVSLHVEDYGRSNPFLPPNESISDSAKYGFDLLAPPESLSSQEVEAAKIMTTKISGIMYNPKSSSAILNIEGSDYLVRAGDYINRYKVLAIAPDMVTVQLGNNIYKAKVGEIITETLNHNTIDNLSNKFGGANK